MFRVQKMNYKKIHDKLIKYLRNTNIKTRIFKRNKNDSRLTMKNIYVEVHHIIPRSLGGVDELYNLVETLPEEHLFLHMLRYKIFRKREDALAVRFMLNGICSREAFVKNKLILNKKIRSGYCWLRTHAQFLRKTEGWHSPEGIERIRESRRGKMPARDILTGGLVGQVELTHPNVLSGRWVHHSKGRKQSREEIEAKIPLLIGQNNPNASGLTEEYFVEKGLEMFHEFGKILAWGAMLKLSKSRGFKWIKSLKSRFGGKGMAGYFAEMERITGAKHEKYQKNFNLC